MTNDPIHWLAIGFCAGTASTMLFCVWSIRSHRKLREMTYASWYAAFHCRTAMTQKIAPE